MFKILVAPTTVLCFIVLITMVTAKDTYTVTELKAIETFRHIIKDVLTQDYMSENKYLIRFLRANNLDLKSAEQMIRRTYVWRQENKMDRILTEDFSKFELAYPFSFRLRDYDGRPALSSRLGQINIRRLILSGHRLLVRRYLLYGLERGVANLHKVSKETGKEFVGMHLLFNMAGYDLRTHSCLQCVGGWITLVQNYENNYPQLASSLVVINIPRIFETLYSILKPLASPSSQKILRLYGVNKAEWQAELLKIYPEDQLTPEFGGTFRNTTEINEKV